LYDEDSKLHVRFSLVECIATEIFFVLESRDEPNGGLDPDGYMSTDDITFSPSSDIFAGKLINFLMI